MRDAVQNSLNLLEDEVGDLDEFVASRIGMDVESMQRNFSAEQVDALAMAINNAEHGGGFIIGDQTGIGKGRIVAGMIRYAINRGLMPVFVTEKPNLYADMMRDLSDIGMGEMLGYGTDDLRVLMTNKDESVPYGANGEYAMPKLGRQADAVWQEMIANEQAPSKYLAIFTTYSQMQTSGGAMPDRMKAIQAIMPNAYLILDESHNAGGTGAAGGRKTAKQLIAERTNGFVGRSGFMRLLVQKAKASFFSSATYAKRPNVMDLYQSTNMIHAVDKPEQLGDAIARGGVPLQQITAAMLAADGQYMRRERSFHGVKYDTKPVAVDKDAAENMAHAMSEVLNFSRMKEGAIGKLQDEYDAAGAMLTDVGNNAKTSVEGANFGSIMHNLIDQMLLALKTKGAVDEAMAALERGEKVVLTVANTMGSFIADYAKEMELSAGQPVNLSFTDLYRKYLEKQRWVRIKSPNGETSLYRLTDDDLGPVLSSMFRRIDDWMKQANFGDAPISPIDYLHAELRKRKVNGKSIATDEITGRTATINYEGVTPVLASRSSSIKTRLKAINGFNNGDIDVLILNQSGSTGLSLHASEKFKDQRPRHMILIQAEKNIDTHMQMLGRIHRTGQVKLPIYSQLMADIPAELRPAAVLQGKMAKLTANTTASKDSDFAADGVVDFMNDYGGQVAVEYLLDNPEVYHKLGGADMMTLSQDDASEDDIRKLTGYIPLLPIKMQEKVYGELVARYNELIQRETELGTNKLEARALDLDAETLASEVADPGKPEKKSLFSAPVVMERVSVKRTSKPLTREQVEKVVSNRLGGVPAHAISRDMQNDLREKTGEYIKKVVAERTERGDEEAKIEAAVDVIRGMLAIANDKISSYRIGTSHQINLDGQIFYGIVTDVKHHDRAANPAAQSAWTVQFALAMADANSVTIPFSQLGDKFKTELTSGTMWGDLASGGNRWVSINELFDLAQTSGREKRWMVTGNLLSGYAKFPGQLVHYTKQDGSQAQGILMSRAYDYGKTKEMLGARFNKVERILEFFSQAPSRSVITDQDSAMRIEQDRPGSFVIQVPKSKRQGGHYFLDTQLTDIIGKDFVTVGAQMRATVQGIDQIGNVLRHVLGEQADYFTAMTNKDVANRINDAANQKLGGDAPATLSASPGGNDRNTAVVVDAVAANDAIAAAMSGLEGAPSVTLAESFSDLPPEIQAEAKDQDAGEANFKGAYKRGHIWILRANHATVEDIEATLFHELYGHHGTRALFGNKWMQEINKLYASVGGWNGVKAIAAKRGINLEEYRNGVLNWEGDKKIWRDPVMMEELLAHMAEQQPNQKLRDRIKDGIKRLVGMFRQWLRDKGFAQLAQRGETDLLHILAQASQAVREGKSVKSGPAFSVLSRDQDALNFVQEVLAELSFEDGLFRNEISQSKTIQGNIEHFMPGAEYMNSDVTPEELEHEGGIVADKRMTFAAPSEKIFYVYTKGDKVWVDISRLLPGDKGAQIYHAIANYAVNANKVFVGDPNGLSEDAIVRRTVAMLSSALRFGSIDHFEPAAQQLKGVPSKGIEPLKWSGNYVDKVKSLVDNYVKTLQNTYPDIKDYRYDFNTNQYLDRNGTPVNEDGFDRLAERSHGSRAARAGASGMRRGIFLQSLLASPRSGQPGLLEAFLRGSGQLVQQGSPLHALFRRGAAEAASGNGRGAADGLRDRSGQAAASLSADDAPTMMRRSVSETLADKLQASSPKIADALRDTFATNEKFGWWHKTLGTQHHKAHLDKDFAKVYHAAQAFERDTARMASEAADLAPDLLPKMDGIGDTLRTAKNVKRDAQDSAAISPWVYYGTLAESVFTDEQLRNPDAVIAKFGQLLPESQPLKPLTERQIKLYRQYHAAINKSLEDLAISEMGRLARMAKLDMAEPTMTMHEAARFYFEQIAGEIQRLSGALEELQEEQKAEAKLLEDAAEDEATGADQRKRYAKLLMDMKAKHKEQREAITEPLADLLNMKEHFIGRAMKIKELQDKGYAPLMRFGKYTVDVTLQDKNGKVLTDADGNELRPFFGMFESEAEANAVARELREEYPDHTVTQGILSEHQHQLFQGITPENVELYAKAVGMDTDEAFQRYLKLATANRSAMKRLIHRKGTAGFSFDATRSLASFITSNSRAASSNLHIGDMLKAVADIDKTKGDVKDEAIKLMEYVRSPAEGGVAIRSLLFFQYLGGSVASALVNMTQTFTTTFPYLSQEKFGGPKKAADELRKAMAMSAKRMRGGSTGDKALDALLKRAEEEGVVAPHEIHMLQGEAGRGSGVFANSPLWRSLENKYPALRFTSRFIDAGKSLWGSFFSLAEQYNRQVAFIAAYQMAKQQGKSEAQAYAMAEQAVEESQFNYQKSARPNLARSAVGATLLTFKTFLINYLEFLKRLPNRERAIAVGMLVLLAGAQGAPGADDLDDIIDTIGQAAGYSTNSKRWKREVLGDIFGNSDFGKAASGFILHGVSEFLPMDISGRLSVGNIIPATSLFKRDNTSTTDEVAELVGPAGGLAKKLYEGAKGVMSGDDPTRMLMYVAAPKAIADAYQGVDMLQTGIYRDYRGRKVTDASALDAAVKAIGFQPNDVATIKRAERLVQQDIALFRNVKQDIAERWARGIFERDTDKVAKAREELRAWNEKNPSMPMAVKNSQIQRRVTEMKKTSGERVASASPKEIRGNVEHTLRAGELQ